MTADLPTREKALALAEAHSKAFNDEADADKNISDAAYAALEQATKDAETAIETLGLHALTTYKTGKPFRCPNPDCCWPIMEEDLEV